MEEWLQRLKLSIGFFTRIPLPDDEDHRGDLANAAITFPIAGFLIGALLATIWLIADYFLPALPAAAIAIAAGLVLTGALHEDGLSDCADGLGGNVSKERALEIMRDSRIGTYGAAALIITIGLRWSGLASLDMWFGFSALIIAHMTGRAAITVPMYFSKYARKEGLGKSVSNGIDINQFSLTLLIPILISFLIAGWQGLLAVVVSMVAAWLVTKWLDNKIGGYTGDGLGAVEQISEITALLVIVACLA